MIVIMNCPPDSIPPLREPSSNAICFSREIDNTRREKDFVGMAKDRWSASRELFAFATFRSTFALRRVRTLLGELTPEVYAFRTGTWATAEPSRGGDRGLLLKAGPFEQAVSPWLEAARASVFKRVELTRWSADWSMTYAKEFRRLRGLLPFPDLTLDHIGSTAVPGLHAKPIIDILIRTRCTLETHSLILPLRDAGYEFIDYPGNQLRLFFKGKQGPHAVHVHAAPRMSAPAQDLIDFRDALRSDPGCARRYARLKLDAAQSYRGSRANYGARKSQFIRETLRSYRSGFQDTCEKGLGGL